MQENIIGYRIKLLRENAKLWQAKLAMALGGSIKGIEPTRVTTGV